MLFGYSSHYRWLSCSRRWFAEYPCLYTLRSPPYALHRRSRHQSCARRWLAVSPVFPCQSVLIRGRYISATCCVLPVVWQCSRLFPFAPVAVLCSAMVRRVSSPLHLTLYTLHQKNHQKCIFLGIYIPVDTFRCVLPHLLKIQRLSEAKVSGMQFITEYIWRVQRAK